MSPRLERLPDQTFSATLKLGWQLGDPDEIAHSVAVLACNEAINIISGIELFIDNGIARIEQYKRKDGM